MKKIYYQIILICLLFGPKANAQDFVFTQFFNAPQLHNAAATGFFSGSGGHRISIGNRNQWGVVPWATNARYGYLAAYDMRRCVGKSFLAAGAAVQLDAARVDANAAQTFRNLRANFSLAYHQRLSDRMVLSGGATIAMLQYSLDPAGLQWDRQFNPSTGYSSSISSGEDFATTSRFQPDLDAGILLYKGKSPFGGTGEWAWSVGAGVHHLMRPWYSFLEEKDKGDNSNRLRVGYSLHGNFLAPEGKALLTGFFKKQSVLESRQWTGALGAVWREWPKPLRAGLGLFWGASGNSERLISSALSPYLSFELTRNWVLGASFDLSLSRTVSSRAKGFEITSRWQWGKPGGKRDCIVCPF